MSVRVLACVHVRVVHVHAQWRTCRHDQNTSSRYTVSRHSRRYLTVNLDIFIVTFRSRRQLRLLILRKHMCTISINVIWSHSYEKYINTKFSHNTIVNISEYKNFQIHSLSCGFCIVYDATCGPSITVIFPESGLLSLALPHARC